MKRYSLWSILSGQPRPYPWRRGWMWVLQHDLCFWLTPRLPLQLRRYVVRDAMMRLAATQGRSYVAHPSGTPADLLWAYKK